MRITRIVVPVVATVGLLSAPAGPAFAENIEFLVASTSGVPDGYVVSPSGVATYRHVTGPSTPPLGTGSLRLVVDPQSYIEIASTFAGDPINVTAFESGVYVPAGNTSHVVLGALATEGSVTHVATTVLPHTGTWVTYNVLTSSPTFTTSDYEPGIGNTSTGDMTWSQWSTATQGSDHTTMWFAIDTYGFTAPESIYLDSTSLTMGCCASYRYNFEASPPAGLSNSASNSSIVYGKSVTLRTTLSGPAGALGGEPVTLWSRKAGKATFSRLTTKATDETGGASFTTTPRVNTTYEWRYAGGTEAAAKTSARRTVGVATRLTLRVADTTLSAAQKLKARGATTPVGKGLTVKLWKKRSGADLLIAKTTTASDGTWHVSKDVAKGKYDLYATVSATSRNLAGKSRIVTVTSA